MNLDINCKLKISMRDGAKLLEGQTFVIRVCIGRRNGDLKKETGLKKGYGNVQ